MGSSNSKKVANLSRDEKRWLESQDPNQIAALITAARKNQSMNGLAGSGLSESPNNKNQQYNPGLSSRPNHYISATALANGQSFQTSNQVKLSPYNKPTNNMTNWQMQSLNNHPQQAIRANNKYHNQQNLRRFQQQTGTVLSPPVSVEGDSLLNDGVISNANSIERLERAELDLYYRDKNFRHHRDLLTATSCQNLMANRPADGYCSCSSDSLCDCDFTSPSSSELLVTESTNLPPFDDAMSQYQQQKILRRQAIINAGGKVSTLFNQQENRHSRQRRAARNSGAHRNPQQDQYGQPFVPIFPSKQARYVTSDPDILETSGNTTVAVSSNQKHNAHRRNKLVQQQPPTLEQQQYNPQDNNKSDPNNWPKYNIKHQQYYNNKAETSTNLARASGHLGEEENVGELEVNGDEHDHVFTNDADIADTTNNYDSDTYPFPRNQATFSDYFNKANYDNRDLAGNKQPLQRHQRLLMNLHDKIVSANESRARYLLKNKTYTLSASNNTARLASHQNNYKNNNFSPLSIKIAPPNMDLEFQRGLNFTGHQRSQLSLVGILPPAYQDKELQIKWVINYLENCCGEDPLVKYVFLRNLKDFNETLFYATLMSNVEQLMPIVYTPVVGLACQKFSSIYMRPRGLFISLQDSEKIPEILSNWVEKDVRVIVVTDGERILGLGDLGANGMGISIGKLSLYTALAGVPPRNVLPITLDVGTNNETNLADPFYIGLRQKRARGQEYVNFVDEFMRSVVDKWGRSCLIQFEDFGNQNAFNLLERYRASYCTFNDDIQGTASVCLSGLLSATKIIDKRLRDTKFLFYGSGEANLGTATLLLMAMVEQGIDPKEAKSRIWLVDSKGLLVTSRKDLTGHKRTYAQEGPQLKELLEIVEFVKPSAIIGASAQGGAFNETICKLMLKVNARPIIFALSNPTSKAECTAQEAYAWTEGRCIFASGSPFDPFEYDGRRVVTGQGNNAYIFPAVGLAAIAGHMHTIPEEAFLVAATALSDLLTQSECSLGLVYPSLRRIRECTLKIAARLLEYFYSERLATYRPEPMDKVNFLRSIQFNASYPNLPDNNNATAAMSSSNTSPGGFTGQGANGTKH